MSDHPVSSLVPKGVHRRILPLMLLALVALTSALRAAQPFLQLQRTIHSTDFDPSATNQPVVLTGQNFSGDLLAGYYVDSNQTINGTSAACCHACVVGTGFFGLIDDLNSSLNASASVATCMSTYGIVGGVGWTNDSSAAQFGFIWQQYSSSATIFYSPTGGDVDAVIAVNNSGQVIGTYFGYAGYKRAFLWDGVQSIDLGDLGDPDNSFVWPQAINDAGQIVGTVYNTASAATELLSDAFLWQNGELNALDPDGTFFGRTKALNINASAQVVCAYKQPAQSTPNTYTLGGFLWVGGQSSDLGTLEYGAAGTLPFTISDAGQIVGTAYAADGTLHLFSFDTPSATMSDLGSCLGDTGVDFSLTGVSWGANTAVGFLTDTNGIRSAVWRNLWQDANGWDHAMYPLISMLPGNNGLVVNNDGQATILVSNDGSVACSGTSQAQPVGLVFSMAVDSDGDGIPDYWELLHGLNPNDPIDAFSDMDGDGLTNLQEYLQGTDPTDFYNGVPPVLTIVSGNGQTGAPSTFLANPLVVQATHANGQPFVNAPIRMTAFRGGLLSSTTDGSSLTSDAIFYTDTNGLVSTYCQLQSSSDAKVTVAATASTAEAEFTEYWMNPNSPIGRLCAGYSSTYAIQIDGTLWSWGSNSSGQLANGTNTDCDYPVPVPTGGENVRQVVAGQSHVAALKGDGSVWTAGDNSLGQLGDNASAPNRNQLSMVPIFGGGVQTIAAGDMHTLALANDGTVWAWGSNAAQQLGQPNQVTSSPVPLQVPGLSNIVQIAAGPSISIAVDVRGNVWTWGGTFAGFFGQASGPQEVSGLGTGVTAIFAGGYNKYVLKADGSVWTWGFTLFGPPAAYQVYSLSNVAAMTVGAYHALAIGNDGSVYACGDNSAGELGIDDPYLSAAYDFTPVPGLSQVVDAGSGYNFSVVAKADGTLWSFGDNTKGQCGSAFHPNILVYERNPVPGRVAYFKIGALDHTVDVDGDGLSDYDEVTLYHTDPTLADTDGDGLSDYDEIFVYHTDPLKTDTDGDGMPDGWEVAHGLNPLDAADANQDLDQDGLTNLREFQAGSDPNKFSTSGDGVPDGWKVDNGFSPSSDLTNTDTDGDGLNDAQEYFLGTNPNKWSSADDGIPDNWKLANHLDLTRDVSNEDPDGDGLTNLQEYQAGTDPNNPCSNNDGILDSQRPDVINFLSAWPTLPDVQYAVLDLGVIGTSAHSQFGDYAFGGSAICLNNVGQAVVYVVNSDLSGGPYLWSAGQTQPIPCTGSDGVFAYDSNYYRRMSIAGINDQGVVIGRIGCTAPTNLVSASGAFTWQAGQSALHLLNAVSWDALGIYNDEGSDQFYNQDGYYAGSGYNWVNGYSPAYIDNAGTIYGSATIDDSNWANHFFGGEYAAHLMEFGVVWNGGQPTIIGDAVNHWDVISALRSGRWPSDDPYDDYQNGTYNFIPHPGTVLSLGDANDSGRAIGTSQEWDTKTGVYPYTYWGDPDPNGPLQILPDVKPLKYGFIEEGQFTELSGGQPWIINENNHILGIASEDASSPNAPVLWLADETDPIPLRGEITLPAPYTGIGSYPWPFAFNTTMQMLYGSQKIYRNFKLQDLTSLMAADGGWTNIQTTALNEEGSVLATANTQVNGVAQTELHALILVPYHVELIPINYSPGDTQMTLQAIITLPKWDATSKTLNWVPIPNGTQIVWSTGSGSNGATLHGSQSTVQNGAATMLVDMSSGSQFTIQAAPVTYQMYGAATQTIGSPNASTTLVNTDAQQKFAAIAQPPLLSDEAAGTRYRKVALNGRPLTDSKPQAQPESDHEPEQTYVDALSLTLRHSTTDIYVPLSGDEMALSVRRNSEPDAWNLRRGLRVNERLDRPFGASWSSNLTPNIHFVYQTQAGSVSLDQDADYAYVTDDDGSSYRFLIVYPSGGGQEFFPLPEANHDQATYLATLETGSNGGYVFTKKYGSRLTFTLVPALDQALPGDRLRQDAPTQFETHRYARIVTASDRYGNQIDYTFDAPDTLIPQSIANHANPGQAILITQEKKLITDIVNPETLPPIYPFQHLVTGIQDPNGGQFTFTYQQIAGPVRYFELTQVQGPADLSGNPNITQYHYDEVLEPDSNPDKSKPTPWYHCDLDKFTDARQEVYAFTYKLDHSRYAYSELYGYYPQNGLPQNVDTVTLPDGLGTTQFANRSYVALQAATNGGEPTFLGHRATLVTEATGNSHLYTFNDSQVITLNDVKAYLKPAEITNPAKIPHMVVFASMKVEHYDGAGPQIADGVDFVSNGGNSVGHEKFEFDPSAGMALKSVTDLSGNTTSFAHADPWTVSGKHPWFSGYYPFGTYDDPTSQTDARGHSKTFQYQTDWRLMSQVVDEESRTTKYALDGLGRRQNETISDAGGNRVQETDFAYDNAMFPAFVTRKTVKHLGNTTDPSGENWYGDLVTTWTPDDFGRIGTQVVDPDGLALTTKSTYDLNNNKLTATDPRTFVTTFAYDARNQLCEVDYPAEDGKPMPKKTFTYDANGNKLTETDEDRHTTTYSYDGVNRLTSVSRAMESGSPLVTGYGYNAANSRTSVTDPRNLTTTFDYDALQRLKTTKDPQQHATAYEYGPNSGASAFDGSTFKPTKVTDAHGHVVETSYDELYRPTQITSSATPLPAGVSEPNSVTKMDYDNVGNVRHATDPLGNVTETIYDALNRPTQVNYADGKSTQTLYTSTGLKWKTINELSQETELHYDGAGRLTGTLGAPPDPVNAPTVRPLVQTGYDANGNVASTIDARLNEWDYTYDKRNRKTDEYQPAVADYDSGGTLRPHLSWEHDGVGNVTAATDARQNRTTTAYDWNNRPKEVTAPSVPAIQAGGGSVWVQPVTKTTYDEDGHVLTVTDPNGHQTVNTYDTLNRLETTTRPTDAGDDKVTYGYDPVGNRTSVQDGNGNVTGFGYDGLGRNVTLTDAAGATTTFTYDGLNKVLRQDANGQSTRYDQYDARNRLLHVDYPADTTQDLTYGYDDAGRLLSVTDGHGTATTVAYTYDGLGRVQTETSNGATHTYGYDLNGNRTGVQYGLQGGGNGRALTSTFDALNRLNTLVEGGNHTTRYHYDLDGHVRAKGLPSGETEVTSFDALGRQTDSVDTAANGSSLYGYDYGHDAGGNLRRMAEYKPGLVSSTRTTTMDYDASDRLKTETVYNGTSTAGTSLASQTGYSYDLAGNRLGKHATGGTTTTYTPNNLNQLTGFVEDATGRSVAFTYDLNGNRRTRTEGGTTDTYAYDLENRLASLSKGGVGYAYLYDYRTRRVSRTEGGTSTNVVYSGGTSVAEYPGGGGGASTGPSVEFIRGSDWGGGVGGLLYSVRGGQTHFDHYDARGDVATQTNDAGTVTYQAQYEAYGTRVQEFGADQDRQRACTKEEDPTGLLDEGRRYRDLETGGFLTRDPAGLVDGPNLYAYVSQNPWSKFDPEGLATQDDYKQDQKKAQQWYIQATKESGGLDPEQGKIEETYRNWVAIDQRGIDNIENTAKWQNQRVKDAISQVLGIGDIEDALRGASHFVNAGELDDATSSYKRILDDRSALRALSAIEFLGDALLLHRSGGGIGSGGVATSTVTVFRAESATFARVLVGEGGQVLVTDSNRMLFLNFGVKARADEFLSKYLARGESDAQIKSFEVYKSFLSALREQAVTEDMKFMFPRSPLVVDISKAADQYGLRPDQVEALRKVILEGSGKVH